jgi:DNA-binding transcriptional MerR regulator
MASGMKTFTIKEVSKRSGVSTHTLRFWEKELEGVIVPERTKGGQRRYNPDHLGVIEEIKSLKAKGLRLTDIRRELRHRFGPDKENDNEERADVLADKIAEIVRTTIFNYLNGKTVKEEVKK